MLMLIEDSILIAVIIERHYRLDAMNILCHIWSYDSYIESEIKFGVRFVGLSLTDWTHLSNGTRISANKL